MGDLFLPAKPGVNYGIALNEYKGTWSLVSARVSKDGGKVSPQFAFKSVYNEEKGTGVASEDMIPVGARLGELHEAIDTLEHFVGVLKEIAAVGDKPAPQDDDLPF